MLENLYLIPCIHIDSGCQENYTFLPLFTIVLIRAWSYFASMHALRYLASLMMLPSVVHGYQITRFNGSF
jgi:hypothetical protein